LTAVEPKALKNLSGLISHCKISGDLNESISPGYDK